MGSPQLHTTTLIALPGSKSDSLMRAPESRLRLCQHAHSTLSPSLILEHSFDCNEPGPHLCAMRHTRP